MLGPEAKHAATTLDRIHARPVDEPLGCNRWELSDCCWLWYEKDAATRVRAR
jgi:hypothetical protein